MDDLKNVVGGEVGERLQRELDVGERVVWSAQPVPALYARPVMAFGVIGAVGVVFAMGWIAVGTAAAGVTFGLFGAPFLLVALVFASLPLRQRDRAKRTAYAITDRRALIVVPDGTSWRVDSFLPDDVRSCTRKVVDGGGDLIFRELVSTDSRGRRRIEKIGFLGIADVGGAELVLERTLLHGV